MNNRSIFVRSLFLKAAWVLCTCSFLLFIQAKETEIKAPNKSWSILTYMQADNDLASFADYNIKAMQTGILDDSAVTMLVQWDQPDNNKTWRYRIVPGGRIEDESVNAEMGYNPAQEIVDSMAWVARKYPADHYGLILWNHGSGVEDYRSLMLKSLNLPRQIRSWMELPGLKYQKKSSYTKDKRGILYDDSQNTCLDNQGLYTAMQAVTKNLGKKLDIIGMDACLMAMVEIYYQIRQFADVFVGSQQTEPGEGWNYASWLSALTTNPTMSSLSLATSMVQAYKEQYKYQWNAQDYTLSAIKLDVVDDLKANIDSVALGIKSCMQYDADAMSKMLSKARKASIEMYTPEYIDLYSFYTALLNQLQQTAPKSSKFLQDSNRPFSFFKPSNPSFQQAAGKLSQVISDGMKLISKAVVMNVCGPALANVRGVSIYYPSKGKIHASYYNTLFAKESAWMGFLTSLRA